MCRKWEERTMKIYKRKELLLIMMGTLSLLFLESPFQTVGHTLITAAYADSSEKEVVGVYTLARYWDKEDHPCSGTVEFKTDRTCSFDLTMTDPEESGRGPIRLHFNCTYQIKENYIKLDNVRKDSEDTFSDEFADKDLSCFFLYRISGKSLNLIFEDDDGDRKLFLEKIQ